MKMTEEEYLMHYGTPRHSGRYPWGSGGDDQATRNKSFLDHVELLNKQGLSEPDIAKGFGITTTQLRAERSIARSQTRQADIARAERLREAGNSNIAIGQLMDRNESSVRALLAPGQKDRADALETTANILKDQVDKKGYIDIGSGVENHIGVSNTRLRTAVAVMQAQGYEVHTVQVDQLGTKNKTSVKVLASPGTTYRDVVTNLDKIQQITEFSEDGGRNFYGLKPPLSIDSKRIAVRYKEEGGADADGVIYVRPGVHDVSLDSAHYAQVRIAVDGTHYLKGMAMYKDDLPTGVDLQFNTNKSNTGSKLDAMKKYTDDPDNPFGAMVRQIGDRDEHGNIVKVTSAMNIVNEQGNWDTWSRSLSSQMLSKQSPSLAKTQLDMTFETKKDDLDQIMRLTNPTVRKKLLESYADDADSSAVHLKAAALPRQSARVILPINTLKDTEIYAHNFQNGERVVLIRYPHGGTFEIPELIVNNRHPDAKRILGEAQDAVGINSKVAERLSGADFDGDTVLVIPNNNGRIKTASPLRDLQNFEPKSAFPKYDGMKVMTTREKGLEMGKISNLITDMTIKGANTSELARAVKHSMVVIDAEKHELNYKQSALDNGISALSAKYQTGGASTLISRAKSEVRIDDRRLRSAAEGGPVDRETGKKVFVNKPGFVNKEGVTVTPKIRVKKLELADDAHDLSSGTPIEKLYADHSNKLKALANTARKAAVSTRNTPYSPSAKAAYPAEVKSLNAKLDLALRNRPLERQAQLIANAQLQMKRQSNPNMDKDLLKKVKSQLLTEARTRTGAQKREISITSEEWNAIQAGAISPNILTQILNKADLDQVKKLATPKSALLMTPTKKARAEAMIRSGFSQGEIAQQLGVSLTTLKTSIGGE